MKVLLTAAVAAMALSALVAASASAAIVPAKFSSSSIKMSTSGITLKRGGLEPKTCTQAGSLAGTGEGGGYLVNNQWDGSAKFGCSGLELIMVFWGNSSYDTVANRYFLTLKSYEIYPFRSPYGEYWQRINLPSSGTWVNGSGLTPSTVTFTDQLIGYTLSGNKPITISGTFNVTTSGGGLVTLSH